MGSIDVGYAATDRAAFLAQNYTHISYGNPSNDNGILTSVELWFLSNASNCKVGTFSGGGGTFTNRDYATIGSVTAGSKQTFSGLSIAINVGDYIGVFFTAGLIDRDLSGGAGIYFKAGDQFGAGSQSGYSLSANNILSLYGIGETTWRQQIFTVS